MAEDQNPPADEQDQNNNERKRPGKKPLIILGIVVIVMVIVALVWWFLTRNEETTDDAFTDGDVVTIAPKTAGYVTESGSGPAWAGGCAVASGTGAAGALEGAISRPAR